MTKVVDSREYSTNSIFVGCSVNEDGEPLVEVNGKAIGTVAGLLNFLDKYEVEQKAKINVKWAAVTPPDGYCSGYRMQRDHDAKPASLLMDVPAELVRGPIVLLDGVLYLDDVIIKDAQIGQLSVGATNIEGADKDAVARLQRELDDLKASLPKRVEEAIKSHTVRNVRRY